jgi:peptidoglycan/LPS O-acetylase OafA/YrhL
MKYRAEIDGLRALAIAPVVLFHSGLELFGGGFVGVDVFFVISGYLITTILIKDIEKKRFNILNFYERRARRILPALYTVAISTAIVSTIILYPEYLLSFAKSLIATPLFSANFYFWSERGYFGTSSELKPLIHLWSLAVEEQFYIVFPMILLLIKKFQKTFYVILVLGFIISLGASYYVTKIHFDTAFYFPITRAWELIAGSIAALILHKRLVNFKTYKAELISSFGLLLIVYSYLVFDSQTPFPSVYALIPVIGTFLFIISASFSYYIKKIFSLKPLVFIGLLSFSLYLWHQPIFALARHSMIFDDKLPELSLLTLILSYVTYRYVETPFRNKLFVSGKNIFLFSFSGGILLILIGYFILTNNGFPNRYSVENRALLKQLSDNKGYNQRIFDSLQLRQFSENSKRRIVIVGDSHAKDLLNILVESKLFSNVQFSTHQVNSKCGNLYLENYNIIEKYIPIKSLERCKILGWYQGETFNKILTEADEIWLASSWHLWVIDQLPKSISRLSNQYSVPIRVFGIKSFGGVFPYEMLSIPSEQRVTYTHVIKKTTVEISETLNRTLSQYDLFYPLLQPLCGGNYLECKIFTGDGLLMSADGGHLTKEGAVESANRLRLTLKSISSSLK